MPTLPTPEQEAFAIYLVGGEDPYDSARLAGLDDMNAAFGTRRRMAGLLGRCAEITYFMAGAEPDPPQLVTEGPMPEGIVWPDLHTSELFDAAFRAFWNANCLLDALADDPARAPVATVRSWRFH